MAKVCTCVHIFLLILDTDCVNYVLDFWKILVNTKDWILLIMVPLDLIFLNEEQEQECDLNFEFSKVLWIFKFGE